MSDEEAFKNPLDAFKAQGGTSNADADSSPLMLRLKLLKPGGKPTVRQRWAFPYATLKRAELDSDSKLLLIFVEATVTVVGPRMGVLFDLLSEHRVPFLEVGSTAARSKENRELTLVDEIEVEVRSGS